MQTIELVPARRLQPDTIVRTLRGQERRIKGVKLQNAGRVARVTFHGERGVHEIAANTAFMVLVDK